MQFNNSPFRQSFQVLIVDDDEPPTREVSIAFLESADSTIVFEVTSAKSPEEYYRLIQERTDGFDILIVDLKLSPGRGGDLRQGICKVLAWQRLHSPETMVVVHSVFTDENDPDPPDRAIQVCVEAIRLGAIDCIKKSEFSPDIVVQSVMREIRRRRQPDSVFDSDWWRDHWREIVEMYGGQVIAVIGKQVVAHAATVDALRRQIKMLNPDRLAEFSASLDERPRIMVVPAFEEDDDGPV